MRSDGGFYLISVLPSGSKSLASVTANFSLPYFTLSVALNILLTLLLAGHLIVHSRRLRKMQISRSNHGSLYQDIVTVLIESCALFALVSILFIGPYGAGRFVSDIFLAVLSQVQVGTLVLPRPNG